MKYGMPGRLAALAGKALAVAVAFCMSACGGGGGQDDPVAGGGIPVAKAASMAEMQAYSSPSTHKARLVWVDWVDPETGFRVDKFVNNAWTPVATLPATGGGSMAGQHVEWTGALDTQPTSYRVMALLPGGEEIALKAASGAAELKLGVPAAARDAAIALSMAEPMTGDVKLSVTGAPAGTVSTRFYVDEAVSPLLPTATAGPAFETTWPTLSQADGSHRIRAQLQVLPDTFVEIERSVAVGNADLTARVVGSIGYDAPFTSIDVIVTSRSPKQLVSASLSIDGKPIGTQMSGGCFIVVGDGRCTYTVNFTPLGTGYAVGPHSLQVTVTDDRGQQAQATGTMVKPAPLKIALTSPLASRFTAGKVEVRGELTGDAGFSASLKLSLRSPDMSERVLLERAGYGPFSVDVDMTGQPDGLYELWVTATGSAKIAGSALAIRSVPWQAKPPMAYELVKDLPVGGVLLASGRGGVLMGIEFVPEWIVPGATAGIALTTGRGDSGGNWQFAGSHWLGWIYAGAGLYAWGADGSRQAVSDGEAGVFSAVGPQVGWLQKVGGQATLWLSNLAAPAPVAIALSGDATSVSAYEGAGLSLGVGASGKVVAAYAAAQRTPGDGIKASAVYVYDVATHTHRRISAAEGIASDPLTDGKWVAWAVSDRANIPPGELWLAPLDGSSAPTRLSAALSGRAAWVDGLLVWHESAARTVKVYRDGVTTTLRNAYVAAVGSGAVAYTAGERLYVWTPAKGERLVHSMVGFDSVALADGWLYFAIGSSPTLYRVPL